MRATERCACGLPLHYTDKGVEAQVKKMVAELGEWMPVQVGGTERYMVQRHYIALHGLKAPDLPKLLQQGIVRRG
jgi:hypothetical protein